ncbi:MAG: hemin ABC transporter [Gammaproteobacteria bacterium]|nr:MAG: hemin ABC transporter [Gammaproteobacteria bacterium]
MILPTILSGEHLSYAVGHKYLLTDIDLTVPQGTFAAIIGPNGAGKTTLLNLLDGDNKPTAGKVFFGGEVLSSIDRLQLAQQRAVLPQLGQVPFAVIARDIIALGREPYRYDARQNHNRRIIEHCMEQMDIVDLANNHYSTLSGGEQHRVQIARTLAQIYSEPDADLSGKILFLDEPTNHLDIRHQYSLMQLLKQLQKAGLTIIAVMHDLSLTLQFAEQIILLNKGKKFGDYSPQSLVKSDALSKVYQMAMTIRRDKDSGRYLLIPDL